jgi:hypothetical protein
MKYKSVENLIKPLIIGGHKWQNIDINGKEEESILYFSNIQWILLILSSVILFQLDNGISKEIIGYIMSAFSISVSLFMTLLVSIFDKFEKTDFKIGENDQIEISRLIQKKNFFKRFISITSYLVVLSVIIIILSSLTYIFNVENVKASVCSFTLVWKEIDMPLTIINISVLLYRITLNYLLLNYLFLTLFITGSAYEYYMSEMNRRKIN